MDVWKSDLDFSLYYKDHFHLEEEGNAKFTLSLVRSVNKMYY